MTTRPTTKAAIRAYVRRIENGIPMCMRMESATTVDGAISWDVDGDAVQVGGWATETERGITTVDELVDYAWTERKRILLED